jgi:hypothetical protein
MFLFNDRVILSIVKILDEIRFIFGLIIFEFSFLNAKIQKTSKLSFLEKIERKKCNLVVKSKLHAWLV